MNRLTNAYSHILMNEPILHSGKEEVLWDGVYSKDVLEEMVDKLADYEDIHPDPAQLAVVWEEKQERENPQPLTLDELRQMEGEPVWIITDKDRLAAIVCSDGTDVEFRTNRGVYVIFMESELESSFAAGVAKAYRHKPKEVQG